MAYVAKLYGPPLDEQTARPPGQVRYLVGLHPLEALASRLRRQAAQVGWDETEQQIAISDGGAGLEDFFRVNFPRAVCIIDSCNTSATTSIEWTIRATAQLAGQSARDPVEAACKTVVADAHTGRD